MQDLIAKAPPLPVAFYRRPTPMVARSLLGKVIVTRCGDALVAGEIVETEAYLGARDPAAHTYRGRTERNRSMFEEAGTCYVYFTYGMHHCMNVVTRGPGIGEAVLLRAIAPLIGAEVMAVNRGLPPPNAALRPADARRFTGGPGKVVEALGLGRADDGRRFDEETLRIIDVGIRVARGDIVVGPRVGISKAVELPLRFSLKGSVWVSAPAPSR